MSGQSIQSDNLNSLLARDTINDWLNQAIDHSVSVIHIDPSTHLTLVRFRKDGILHNVSKLPVGHHPALIQDVKSRATKLDSQTGLGSFEHTAKNAVIIVKFSILPVVGGDKLVMYLDDSQQTSDAPSDLSAVGFWGDNKAAVEHALCHSHGVIITGGISQSLSSKTLSAIAQSLSTTMLDVVEINPLPVQTIDSVSHLTNNSANQVIEKLQAAIKQDNTAIIAGHLNDKPVIEAVFEAALSKKLLLGTISANNTAQIIGRLLSSNTAPHLIAANLRLVIATRPVRRLCLSCRESITPSKTAWKKIAATLGFEESDFFETLHNQEKLALNELGTDISDLSSTSKSVTRLWQKSHLGCKACNHTGYSGRIALVETLEPNQAVQRSIILNQTTAELLSVIRQQKVLSLEFDGLVKALRGLTSLEEIVDKRYR